MITDEQDLRNMVEEMLTQENKGFTDWEIDFLDAMHDQDGSYSDGQATKINEIYVKKM